MTKEEYGERLASIRYSVNQLVMDLGATYMTEPKVLEKVLNDAMNGALFEIEPDDKKTKKMLTVTDYHRESDELI